MSIRRRIFLGIILLFSIGFYFLIDFVADDIELRYRESTEEPLVDTARVLASIAAIPMADNSMFRYRFCILAKSFLQSFFAVVLETLIQVSCNSRFMLSAHL